MIPVHAELSFKIGKRRIWIQYGVVGDSRKRVSRNGLGRSCHAVKIHINMQVVQTWTWVWYNPNINICRVSITTKPAAHGRTGCQPPNDTMFDSQPLRLPSSGYLNRRYDKRQPVSHCSTTRLIVPNYPSPLQIANHCQYREFRADAQSDLSCLLRSCPIVSRPPRIEQPKHPFPSMRH